MAKKKGFGVMVCFKGDIMTLEQLFGAKPIMSTQMSKLIWNHIRAKQIEAQKGWEPKVNDVVKYYWKKDDRWYTGTLIKIQGNVYHVQDANGTYKFARKEIMKKV